MRNTLLAALAISALTIAPVAAEEAAPVKSGSHLCYTVSVPGMVGAWSMTAVLDLGSTDITVAGQGNCTRGSTNPPGLIKTYFRGHYYPVMGTMTIDAAGFPVPVNPAAGTAWMMQANALLNIVVPYNGQAGKGSFACYDGTNWAKYENAVATKIECPPLTPAQ